MATNPQRSITEIILLSVGIAIVSSTILLGFWALGNTCSRLITHPIFYPSSWR